MNEATLSIAIEQRAQRQDSRKSKARCGQGQTAKGKKTITIKDKRATARRTTGQYRKGKGADRQMTKNRAAKGGWAKASGGLGPRALGLGHWAFGLGPLALGLGPRASGLGGDLLNSLHPVNPSAFNPNPSAPQPLKQLNLSDLRRPLANQLLNAINPRKPSTPYAPGPLDI